MNARCNTNVGVLSNVRLFFFFCEIVFLQSAVWLFDAKFDLCVDALLINVSFVKLSTANLKAIFHATISSLNMQ